jgi:hypothetical protein
LLVLKCGSVFESIIKMVESTEPKSPSLIAKAEAHFESPPETAVNTAVPSRAPSLSIEASEDLENGIEAEKRESQARHPALGCVDPETHVIGWDGPNDPENPMNYPRSKKWRITFATAFMTFCVSFASSVFSTATEVTAGEFHVSLEVMILGVSLYVLGFACGKRFIFNFPSAVTSDGGHRSIGLGSSL